MNVSIKLIYLGWESNIERKTFRYLLKGQIDRICPSFHQRTIQSNCMTIRLNSHPSCYNYTLQ